MEEKRSMVWQVEWNRGAEQWQPIEVYPFIRFYDFDTWQEAYDRGQKANIGFGFRVTEIERVSKTEVFE